MSLNVLGASIVAAEGGEGGGFHAPTPEEFYQPLFGSGDWAITRPMVVLAISVALLSWFLIATTRKAAIVPGKGQWVTEGVYGLVRNGLARDIIGSHDFLKFVPLLFSLFMHHPGQQPLRHHPADPVPHDEPHRLPDRPDAHRVRGLPRGGHPEERRLGPHQAHDPAGAAQADLRC